MTADDRDTQPPSARTEPPPALSLKPSDTFKRMAGYDDSLFLHVALAAAADGAHEMREARKVYDPAILIAQARLEFQAVVSAGYEMLREPIVDTLAEVRALAPRVKMIEDGLLALRAEFELLKRRMDALENALEKTPPPFRITT